MATLTPRNPWVPGIVCSLCGIAALWIFGAYGGIKVFPAVWPALALIILGWVWGVKTAMATAPAGVKPEWGDFIGGMNELSAELNVFFRHIASEFEQQIASTRSELKQAETVLADAIEKLYNGFVGLESSVQVQQGLTFALMQQQGQGGEQLADALSLDSFLRETSDTLSAFVDNVVESSMQAMSLVEKVDDVNTDMDKILGVLNEVKSIADQTNLLALNAAIEAARAGPAGRGFAVVADEVRKLSLRSNQFSEEIRKLAGGVHGSLQAAEKSIEEITSKDMVFALQSKANVEQMMVKIQSMNDNIIRTGDELSDVTRKIDNDVRIAIMSLQFQDMVTQLIKHSDVRLDAMSTIIADIGRIAAEESLQTTTSLNECIDRVNKFKSAIHSASDLIEKTKRSPVKQMDMDAGSIDLF